MTAAGPGRLRLLLAVAGQGRERALSGALAEEGVDVAARCLDAPSILEQDLDGVDAALLSADLHRLTPAVLAAVRERRLPVALLAGEGADSERYGALARVLSPGAGAQAVAATLQEIARGEPAYEGAALFGELGAAAGAASPAGGPRGTGVAVTSGKGAPGKTTVAIALAAELARRDRRVALVDADLRGGNVAPALDLDPRRGLVGLQTSGGGADAGRVAEELQDGPGFSVLAGVERPGLAAGLREETLPVALAALRESHDHVVVDLASYGTRERGSRPDPVLRASEHVLLVAGPDPVSLWNAQLALAELAGALPRSRGELGAVVNRRADRSQHAAGEVAGALGIPVLATLSEDAPGARRALERRLPLAAGGGRSARELGPLAARLAGAPAAAGGARRPWPRLPAWGALRRGLGAAG